MSQRGAVREYTEALLVAGLFLLFSNTWVLKTFYIPSGSMLDTLLIGDHLVVDKFIFGEHDQQKLSKLLPQRAVRRGDILVFRSPVDPGTDLVKRCVGLPGDTVMLRNKVLFINGQRVEEPWVQHTDPRIGGIDTFNPNYLKRDRYGPYRVPEDHYFCMGDNRDESYDSRFWGPLPAHLVKGRPVFVYWSFGGEPPPTEGSGAGHLRHLARTAAGFFTKTRWSRTFLSPR